MAKLKQIAVILAVVLVAVVTTTLPTMAQESTDTTTSTGDREVADHVYLEFEESGNVSVTVEAYNSETSSWETVVDANEYTVEGSAESPDVVQVDLEGYGDGDTYTEYDVTTSGEVAPTNTGVQYAGDTTTGGGGIVENTSDDRLLLYGVGALFAAFVLGASLS